MGKINWVRVLLGGLVAGLVINIFEYVTNGVVLAANWNAAMKALGRQFSMSAVTVNAVLHGSRETARSAGHGLCGTAASRLLRFISLQCEGTPRIQGSYLP